MNDAESKEACRPARSTKNGNAPDISSNPGRKIASKQATASDTPP